MTKNKFTRSDIQEILCKSGLDSGKARKVTIQIIESLAAALASGHSAELRGLGSFEVKERKAYKARNPKTGAIVETPARKRIIFRPGRWLKAKLSGEELPM